MKIQRGEWRVVGRRSDVDELLVRPLSEDMDLVDGRPAQGSMRVSTSQYGGELEAAVADLVVGNRIEAAVYPGSPGRFVDVRVVDSMELVLVPPAARFPDFVLGMWRRATDDTDRRGATVANMPLVAAGTFAEAHVVEAKHGSRDLWAEFVSGDFGERQFTSFTHYDGAPAEIIAAKPSGQSFFYFVKFGSHGSPAATEFRDELLGDATRTIAAKLAAQYPDLQFEVKAE